MCVCAHACVCARVWAVLLPSCCLSLSLCGVIIFSPPMMDHSRDFLNIPVCVSVRVRVCLQCNHSVSWGWRCIFSLLLQSDIHTHFATDNLPDQWTETEYEIISEKKSVMLSIIWWAANSGFRKAQYGRWQQKTVKKKWTCVIDDPNCFLFKFLWSVFWWLSAVGWLKVKTALGWSQKLCPTGH